MFPALHWSWSRLAQVLSDALPAKLCATLLSVLLADSLTYRRGKWRIYGEHKEMPRSTCHYALDAEVRTLCSARRATQFDSKAGWPCPRCPHGRRSSVPGTAPRTWRQRGPPRRPCARPHASSKALCSSDRRAAPLLHTLPCFRLAIWSQSFTKRVWSQRTAPWRACTSQDRVRLKRVLLAASEQGACAAGPCCGPAQGGRHRRLVSLLCACKQARPAAGDLRAGRPGAHTPPKQPWLPRLLLQLKHVILGVLRYSDKSESVAPHTDKLTALGRRPVIASLSLGATRTFRVTRAPVRDLPGMPRPVPSPPAAGGPTAARSGQAPAVGGPSAEQTSPPARGGAAAAARPVSSPAAAAGGAGARRGGSAAAEPLGADIALRHNTLLIMWPPSQEEFLHEARRPTLACSPCPCEPAAALC